MRLAATSTRHCVRGAARATAAADPVRRGECARRALRVRAGRSAPWPQATGAPAGRAPADFGHDRPRAGCAVEQHAARPATSAGAHARRLAGAITPRRAAGYADAQRRARRPPGIALLGASWAGVASRAALTSSPPATVGRSRAPLQGHRSIRPRLNALGHAASRGTSACSTTRSAALQPAGPPAPSQYPKERVQPPSDNLRRPYNHDKEKEHMGVLDGKVGDRHRLGPRHRPRDRGAARRAGRAGPDQRPRRRRRRAGRGRDRGRDGRLRAAT